MTAAIPEHAPLGPPEELTLTRNSDGTIRVENAPLPERIAVTAELWDELNLDPTEEDSPEFPHAWLETIAHAGHVDGDGKAMAVDNDGYVLHVDAVNVVCSYRFNYPPTEDRNATGVLVSWGEK